MTAYGELYMKKKLVEQRINSIGRIKHQSRPENKYRAKVRYIENNIEREMKFF